MNTKKVRKITPKFHININVGLFMAKATQIPLRYLVRSWSQTGLKLVGNQL